MPNVQALAVISRLSAPTAGTFRGRVAVSLGVTRDQLRRLSAAGAIQRVHPDVYRMTAVRASREQRLRAALLWAGEHAAATGRSAAALYGLDGVSADVPEIALPHDTRGRSHDIVVRHGARAAFMTRRVQGIPTTGPEYTLLWLAHALDEEAFEVAFEDARRRRLTSFPALHACFERFGRRGRPGLARLRRVLAELDPTYPSRSKLEVRTRRLLAAGTTIRPTTSTTTTSGACPVATATDSCWPPGTRSRERRTH
jgi:hypothetical protein